MFTDDYRKQSYLDVQVSWIDRQTPCCSGCQTLWSPRLILEIIAQAVNSILAEYCIPECGLGWVTLVQKIMGWVGFGPFAVGLSWAGSTNMDPCSSMAHVIVQSRHETRNWKSSYQIKSFCGSFWGSKVPQNV